MDLVNYDMEAKGYIDAPIDPSLDLIQEIKRLKKRKKRRYISTLLSGSRDTGYC